MRFRRVLTMLTVFSLLAGVAFFVASAGAAAPTLTLSPKSGPAGTAITVTLSTPCKVPNQPGLFGALSTSLSAANPVGSGGGFGYVSMSPGQSVSHTILNVSAGTPAGHYFMQAECEFFTGTGFSDLRYTAAPFLVTGGPVLPPLTISRASGPVGTVIDVSGACAPSVGQPSADFAAAIFSPTNSNLGALAFVHGVGPVQHAKLTVPANFQPAKYQIAASCSDYVHSKEFGEKTFTVLPSAPAAPAGVSARPGTTTSTTIGPIVVTFATALNHGVAIMKYTATCSSSNGGVRRAGVHLGPTAAPIVIPNATLRRTYRCVVTATNAKGTGPASLASAPIVVGAPARVGTPTATRIAAGKERIAFHVLTAAQTNGAPLTTPKYTTRCVSINGGVARAVAGVGSPIVVAGLTAGRFYSCWVVAHNARGASAPSPVVAALP